MSLTLKFWIAVAVFVTFSEAAIIAAKLGSAYWTAALLLCGGMAIVKALGYLREQFF